MKSHAVVAIACACLATGLAACGQAPHRPAPLPAPPAAQPTLSEAAGRALLQAEADIALARARFALWTSAENALTRAREAAGRGDSAEALRQAAIASEQARLGLEQLDYPSTELR